MFDDNLFKRVLITPAVEGANQLEIFSGYASASTVERHLEQLHKLKIQVKIRLTVGMASPLQGPIEKTQHEAFIKLHKQGSLSCAYWIESPPVHAKVYVWAKDNLPVCAFTGSANYTQRGFGKAQREILTPVDLQIAWDWCQPFADNAVYCDGDGIEDRIILDERKHERGLKTVTLPLYQKKDGEVHDTSGLNWGQRKDRGKDRDPNQAYIPIPAEIGKSGFFPKKKTSFKTITDDRQNMFLVVAQDNDKALHSTESNALLGLYFRGRLGLKSGEYVTRHHLNQYERCDVEFKKIDDDNYLMNFAPNMGPQS